MWIRVEDVDEEISIFDSHHCFEGFIFGFRKVIMDEKRFRYIQRCMYGVMSPVQVHTSIIPG